MRVRRYRGIFHVGDKPQWVEIACSEEGIIRTAYRSKRCVGYYRLPDVPMPWQRGPLPFPADWPIEGQTEETIHVALRMWADMPLEQDYDTGNFADSDNLPEFQ